MHNYYISLRGLNQEANSESRARLMGEPYCIFPANVKNPTCCATKAAWTGFGKESVSDADQRPAGAYPFDAEYFPGV